MSEQNRSKPSDGGHEPGHAGYSPAQFSGALSHLERWVGSYLQSLEGREVVSDRQPGETLALLPEHPPQEGEGMGLWEGIEREMQEIIEPGLVHWQSPGFFAYFPCSGSLPGVMGELASAVMNVNGMLWSTSPSATELEMRMVDWCAALFGLPDAFRFDAQGSSGGGCIQGTASEGVLSALCAARKRKVETGRDRGSMCVYTSTQAHSSIVKAAMVAGLADGPEDRSRVRLIETDVSLRMLPGALRESIERDLIAGLTPCMVSTTQGTTSTGAVDPLHEIGRLLATMPESKRPWLHADAAWAGVAAVCPELRGLLGGVEHADSLCINPHKWLLTNFDCDLFWVRDRSSLTGALSITPEYLRNEQSDRGGVVDFRDWHVPLGRRMRALKLWWVIRYFGADGLRAHVRRHIRLAWRFEQFVENEPRLRVVFERALSLVCFIVDGEDEQTRRLIDAVNARRLVMISHTRVEVPGLGPRWVARVAVGAGGVEERHIDMLVEEIGIALREVIE